MVRVLVGGLPGRTVRELRDAGHEVVLVDVGVSADQLAATAVQEDVVAIALTRSDADVPAGDLPTALAAYGAGDIVVFTLDRDAD